MARKLDVAIGLLNHPQVLFLDEPTTGLDPEARAAMWAELESMARSEQMTVLLTTHYLEEADRLASQLAIVDHGRIVVTGSPDELKNGLHGDAVFVELAHDTDLDAALHAISRVGGLGEVLVDGRTLRGRATVARPSLDDVYLKYTGHAFASSPSRTSGTGAGSETANNTAQENAA